MPNNKVRREIKRQQLAEFFEAMMSTYHDFSVSRVGIDRWQVTASQMAWQYVDEVVNAKTK